MRAEKEGKEGAEVTERAPDSGTPPTRYGDCNVTTILPSDPNTNVGHLRTERADDSFVRHPKP